MAVYLTGTLGYFLLAMIWFSEGELVIFGTLRYPSGQDVDLVGW